MAVAHEGAEDLGNRLGIEIRDSGGAQILERILKETLE